MSRVSRRRFLARFAANGLLAVGGSLFGTAAAMALSSRPTVLRKALPQGTVFSVPVSALAGASATPTEAVPRTGTDAAATSATQETSDQAGADAAAPEAPTPDAAAVKRLLIPVIKVNAPVSVKDIDAHGVMETPNSWYDVAYYDFSGKPGYGPGNNAVFAGHVDYYPHRTAVFWNLHTLKPGDQVQVALDDGTSYTYLVSEMIVYPADNLPLDYVIGSTPVESVTLMTCDGTFNGAEYNNRLVVRAVRQPA
jgi:sortase A